MAEHGADRAVHVADRELERRRARRRSMAGGAELDQLLVECPVEAVVLLRALWRAGVRRRRPARGGWGTGRARRLPVVDGVGGVEALGLADRLLEACGSRARRGARGPPRR